MPANPFDDLLQRFRDAYAEFCMKELVIYAAPAATMRLLESSEGTVAGVIGFVITGPLSPADEFPGYFILGDPCGDALRKFKSLARVAGASLPAAICDSIPHADPGSLWLTYLWRQSPPDPADLAQLDSGEYGRLEVWTEPFRDSIEAIERGGLSQEDPPDQGEWLVPTTLADMANRLNNVGKTKARSILTPYGLKRSSNRQLWTVRLDKLPANIKSMLTK